MSQTRSPLASFYTGALTEAFHIKCWALAIAEGKSARLTCQGWRGGPDVVSLLLPFRCLPPELHRGVAVHEFLVAGGALWTEPAWCQAGGDAS